DEHDAALAKAVDHGTVVDDLVVNVKRSAEEFQSPLQALDRHVDARAEAARVGQNDFHDALPPSLRLSYRERHKPPSEGGLKTASPPARVAMPSSRLSTFAITSQF